MSGVDDLISQAERVAEALRSQLALILAQVSKRPKAKDFRALGGELRKVIQFYQRRLAAGVSNPEQEVLNLLAVTLPDRGKTGHYWTTLRDVLGTQLHALRRRNSSGNEVAFILGWVFRLLR